MTDKKLNFDFAGKVSEFELLVKRVLPKNIIYRLTFAKGLEFEGYRDFSPSDDALLIDWKASARANKILTRQYIEERDFKIILVADISDNMVLGSNEKLKCEYCAELAAALAHLILISGDKLGFVLFNDEIIKIQPPKQGLNQFESLVHDLSEADNYGKKSNLNFVLESLTNHLPSSTSLVILMSDFLSFNDDTINKLRDFSGLFETIAFMIKDPLDISFPEINKEIIIENTATGEMKLINPAVAKKIYEKNALKHNRFIINSFENLGIDYLELDTTKSFAPLVANFLKKRIKL